VKAWEFTNKMNRIVAKLPPGKVGAFGLMLDSMLEGKGDVAAANASIVAEAVKASERKPTRLVKK
jgi:alkylated DNA nucleotide flippase Atl1